MLPHRTRVGALGARGEVIPSIREQTALLEILLTVGGGVRVFTGNEKKNGHDRNELWPPPPKKKRENSRRGGIPKHNPFCTVFVLSLHFYTILELLLSLWLLVCLFVCVISW